MKRRKPTTRRARPAPERRLPPACADDGTAAMGSCDGGCVPGGCALAIGWTAGKPEWRGRRLRADEEEAMAACRAGNPAPGHVEAVAELADECWRAGCPLEEPGAWDRRGGCVEGRPGFCDALPDVEPETGCRPAGCPLAGCPLAALLARLVPAGPGPASDGRRS